MKGLPIAQFPAMTSAGSTYYVVTKADQRGRLADRSPLQLLGWQAGTTIAVRVRDGCLITVTLAWGPHAVTGQGHLQLPLAVRRLCGIEPGDRLLVGASRGSASLMIYSTDVLDAILEHQPSTRTGVFGA